MTSWLDTPLQGRELIEYVISRLGDHWEQRNGQLVGHAQGAGPRKQRTEPNVFPANYRKQKGGRS